MRRCGPSGSSIGEQRGDDDANIEFRPARPDGASSRPPPARPPPASPDISRHRGFERPDQGCAKYNSRWLRARHSSHSRPCGCICPRPVLRRNARAPQQAGAAGSYLVIVPQAIRSPAFPEGSLFRSSAFAWIMSAVPPLANNGIASITRSHARIHHSDLGSSIRFHSEIQHVARVRLGSHWVVNPVVRVGWVEVASRCGERGAFAISRSRGYGWRVRPVANP